MDDGLPLIDVPVPHEERVAALVAAFRGEFGRDPEGIAEAPGRVNLIGEHVDYNDGLVLPLAIDRSVLCGWSRRDPRDASAASEELRTVMEAHASFMSGWHPSGTPPEVNDDDVVSCSIYSVDYQQEWPILIVSPESLAMARLPEDDTDEDGWQDYPTGVVVALRAGLHKFAGFDGAVTGDVPAGSGLSSSAAIEVATAGAFRNAFDLAIRDPQLAQLCQRAENEYVGVQCGIMDQFASALSKAGHALLIDCRTLAYRHVPLRLAEHGLAIVIANSAVRRELVTSAYNERRAECEEAVSRLRDLLGRPSLHSLRDVRADEIAEIEIDAHDVALQRARHVVSEIDRVAEAVDALERDDFAQLGVLMAASHASLRDDYEVSSEQLDLLVGLASAREYVLGARLTGAGFGGCTVNLMLADRVEDFAHDVIAPYRERTGLSAVMYVTEPCDGLRTWGL